MLGRQAWRDLREKETRLLLAAMGKTLLCGWNTLEGFNLLFLCLWVIYEQANKFIMENFIFHQSLSNSLHIFCS
jgi:hypothetical protein